MAAELDKLRIQADLLKASARQLAERFEQVGEADIAEALTTMDTGVAVFDAQATVARSRGHERFSPTELELTVRQQVDRLINQFGLHLEVYTGLDPQKAVEAYRRDFILPDGAAMSEEYKGRFDGRILVVDPRVELSTLHQRADVTEYIITSAIKNLTAIPRVPYVTFTHDSQQYRPYSVEQALGMFAEDEVGRPQVEISHHYLQFPKDFTKNGMVGMDAAGSRYGDGRVPYLSLLDGRPEVFALWIGDPLRGWGAGSRGKDVIELGAR